MKALTPNRKLYKKRRTKTRWNIDPDTPKFGRLVHFDKDGNRIDTPYLQPVKVKWPGEIDQGFIKFIT